MIKIADIIIWDEAVMANKYVYMALDRTLRDLRGEQNKLVPFGNITIVFGGDFRQVLPVVKRGNRSSIVNSTIKATKFWPQIIKYRLIEI